MLITFTLWLINFSLALSMSFMDYRFELERGNRIIHASLTDKETGQVWLMEEKISSADRMEGKIELTQPKTPENVDSLISIFYSFKRGYDRGKRLVIQNNNCDFYQYKSDWDQKLPGVTKPLTNMILLMGPSFFYRITNSKWTLGNDTIVRGSLMYSSSTILDRKMKVTVYYKYPEDATIGVTQPNRIVLTGYDPNELVDRDIGETLIVDIYLQSIVDQDLAELVQPTPGIGCPVYLQDNMAIPSVVTSRIHFLANDITINDQQSKLVSLKEIHADEIRKTLRLSETRLGFTSDFLYDFNLGVRYTLSSSGECQIWPVDSKSPGIDSKGNFNLAALIWLESIPSYLGQVNFEHRSGFKAKVWESFQVNKVIEEVKYDKVVTTIFLAPSNDSILTGYMFIAATQTAYNKDKSGNFQLAKMMHRDFYEFDYELTESEYQAAFKLGDCFTDPTKRLTLTIHLKCDTGKKSNCIRKSENLTYSLRESLIDVIDHAYGLSPLRIVDVKFIFSKESIEADVTIVEAPSIDQSFSANINYIKISSVKRLFEASAKSAVQCLKFLSSYNNPGRAIGYCKSENLCFSTDEPDKIVPAELSDGGTLCSVYQIPLRNLRRFGQEKSLKEIHDHLLNEIMHEKFDVRDTLTRDTYTYEIVNLIAANKQAAEKTRSFYKVLQTEVKLVPNGLTIVEVPNIKRYSDCYRACSRSEDIFCETFTFCQTKDAPSNTSPTTSCYVSSLNEYEINLNLTSAPDCTTYSKNYILDYTPQMNKAYKVPTSVPTELWVGDCATQCATSPDCYSFEFCDGFCTFGGFYTESNTKYEPRCTIYTPKLSQKFKLTGSKLVTQVLHTELDLDMEQCSAFCLDYEGTDGDECKSFNYCPKSESSSSCQLTSYSVSDVKTVTNESKFCHNFELITKGNPTQINQDDNPMIGGQQTVRTTGLGAFGIIMLFLLIGLIIGFVGPYSVIKIKSVTLNKRSSSNFNWSRQVDSVVEDEIQI